MTQAQHKQQKEQDEPYARFRLFDKDTLTAALNLLNSKKLSLTGQSRDGQSAFGLVQGRGKGFHRAMLRNAKVGLFAGECSCGKALCVHLCALALLMEGHTPGKQEPPPAPAPSDTAANDQRRLVFFLMLGPGSKSRLMPFIELEDARPLQQRFFEYRPGSRPDFLGTDAQDWLTHLKARNHQLGPDSEALLRTCLGQGRCFLPYTKSPLQLVKGQKAEARWLLHPDGSQELNWQLPDSKRLFFLSGLWFLDESKQLCGKLETGLEPALLKLFARHSRILPKQLAEVRTAMLALGPDADTALPRALAYQKHRGTKPQPVLRIVPSQNQAPGRSNLECHLVFRYQGLLLPDTRGNTLLDGTRVLAIERDAQAESAFLAELSDLFAIHPHNPFERSIELDFWRLQGPALVQRLKGLGWEILQDAHLPHKLLFADDWQLELVESTGQMLRFFCWFVSGKQRLDLLPLLRNQLLAKDPLLEPQRLAQLPAEQQMTIRDQNNRLLAVPAGLIKVLLDSLFELHSPSSPSRGSESKEALPDFHVADKDAGPPIPRPNPPEPVEGPENEHCVSFRLSPARAASLRLLLDGQEAFKWQEPASLALLREALQRKEQREAELPSGLACELRPYQVQGLAWLQLLGRQGLGGILADDMGLGKSLQCLAWLLSQKGKGPALIIAPRPLVSNWRIEAQRFVPGLRVLVLDGPNPQPLFAQIPQHDLVVTCYPLLCRDQDSLAKEAFHSLVLDEAQWIKNPSSQPAKACRRIQANNRICLTGTQPKNHLGELWALFDFLMPGFLGGPNLFQRLIRDSIEKWQDSESNQRLDQRIGPFLLRRTKAEVLPELPPKTEIPRHLDMEEGQQQLYEAIRSLLYPELKARVAEQGLKGSSINILDALLKLRQVCCDPRLVQGLAVDTSRAGSTKLEYLRTLLPELVAEGRRILLFSQFTDMLHLIEEALKALEIPWLKLTDQSKKRDTLVARFQSGEVPVFLVSLKASSLGLNLTAADTLIHYDPWWGPTLERQATDLAHHLGQDKPVFVYKLLCAGSVEARIQELQARKQTLADKLLGTSDGLASGWNEQDLEYLFAPVS